MRLSRLGAGVRPALRRLLEAYVIPLFAAMLLVLAWTAVIHLVTVDHTVARDAASELSRELADSYEAQIVRNLVAIDHALKTVKYVYETRGGVRLSELQNQGLLPFATAFKVAVWQRWSSARRDPGAVARDRGGPAVFHRAARSHERQSGAFRKRGYSQHYDRRPGNCLRPAAEERRWRIFRDRNACSENKRGRLTSPTH